FREGFRKKSSYGGVVARAATPKSLEIFIAKVPLRVIDIYFQSEYIELNSSKELEKPHLRLIVPKPQKLSVMGLQGKIVLKG
ncbi:MAG: hypothetical protein EA353_09750, partial [Puniceicoccaceae bacterium]